MNERLRREREFHDARFTAGHEARSADRFYKVNAASNTYFKREIEGVPSGARMLDYGCGEGAYAALHAAHQGHSVTAIDISPVALEHAEQEAKRQGVADRVEFRAMNAESLDLDSDSFDLVCGLGVIHHLELVPALGEVSRVVRPSGIVVFLEPLGHNPAINLYRRRTPDQRSEDEHPLVVGDFTVLRSHFSSVECTYFHLLGLLAMGFTDTRRFSAILARLDALDRAVFRTPAKWWAWMVGMRLTGPLRT